MALRWERGGQFFIFIIWTKKTIKMRKVDLIQNNVKSDRKNICSEVLLKINIINEKICF